MAVTFIKKNLSTGSGSSAQATSLATFTTGNLLCVGVTADAGSETLSNVTVTGNSNATISSNSPATNTGRAWIAYIINCTGGTLTITANFSGTGTHSIWAREFAGFGVGTINANTAGTGSGTTVNTPSITNLAGDLLYAVSFEAGTISSVGSPWAAADSNIQIGEADAYLIGSSGSSQAVNWPTSSGAWAAMAASFTPAAAVASNPYLFGSTEYMVI